MVEVIATDEFAEWYAGLDWPDADAVTKMVGLLEDRGVALAFPHSSQIKGSRIALRELRVQSGGRPLRVFYVFDRSGRRCCSSAKRASPTGRNPGDAG